MGKTGSPLSGKKGIFLILVTLAFFSLVPYSNAPLNDFVYDDRTLIVDNPTIKSIKNIGTALRHDYWWGTDLSYSGLYRPVTMISYVINHHFSGNSPFSFHMVNVVLHLVAVLLVFYCVRLLFEGMIVPFVSALLFAVHPIHTEAVTGVVGRAEILAAIFFLGALCLYIRSSENQRSGPGSYLYLLGSLFLYFFALLSKENTIVYIGALAVIAVFLESRREGSSSAVTQRILVRKSFSNRKTILAITGSIVITLAYLAIRWNVLGKYAFRSDISVLDNPMVLAGLYERIVTAAVLFFKYLTLMAFPVHLSADYSAFQIPLSTFPPSGIDMIAGSVSIIFLFLLVFTYLRAKRFFLPFALFAVTYIIPSNLFITIGTIFAERLMYLPSIGLCLLAGVFVQFLLEKIRGHGNKKWVISVTYSAVGLIVISFSARSFVRNGDWKDNMTLFTRAVAVSPKSARAHGNLGQALAESGKYDDALKEFDLFVSIYHDVEKIHINIANIYVDQGKNEEASKEYMKAIKINPEYPYGYYHLGYLYDTMGRQEEAIRNYKHAIELKPDYTDALNNLGALYLEMERNREALELFKRACELEPELMLPLRNQGEACIKLREYRLAEDTIRRYIEKKKNDFKAYYLLSHALAGQEKYGEAISSLIRCIELNDYSPNAHLLLSSLYRKVGKEKEADAELAIYEKQSKK